MPIESDDARGSMPWRSISSAIASMYDGVTMMMSGLKSLDQLHLLLGLPARHRDDRAAELLRAVVRAEAAGEEAISVRDVHDVARRGRRRRGSSAPSPSPRCRCRCACSRRPSACRSFPTTRGCARSLARHGEHAERVVVAQVALDGERKAREVGERAQIVGMHTGALERLPIVRRRCRTRAAATTAAARAAAPRARRGSRVSIGSRSPGCGCLAGMA